MKPTSSNNNKKPLDKVVHRLADFENRYPDVVNPDNKEQESEIQKLQRFAKMRDERTKAVNAFGDKAYSDVLDNLSQEEIDYYAKKRAEATPEELFSEAKENWFFHPSSYYMIDEEAGYQGTGCYNEICVPGCPYYVEEIDEGARAELKRQEQLLQQQRRQQGQQRGGEEPEPEEEEEGEAATTGEEAVPRILFRLNFSADHPPISSNAWIVAAVSSKTRHRKSVKKVSGGKNMH